MSAIAPALARARQVLAREERAPSGRRFRSIAAAHATAGLDGVARPPDVHVGDEPQARRVLDRLVRRAVLAQADRVVREHVDHAQLHQRRHAQRVARVVGEHQERAAVGNEAAVQRDAVHDRAPCRTRARRSRCSCRLACGVDGLEGLDHGEVGAGEVGRAAEQLRQHRPSASSAFCEALRVATVSALRRLRDDGAGAPRAKSCGSSPFMRRSNSAASSGCCAVAANSALHFFRRFAAPRAHPSRRRRPRDLERRRTASPCACARAATSSAPSAAPCAAPWWPLFGAPLPMIVLQQISVGLSLFALARLADRRGDRLDVVAVDVRHDLPAVGLEALRRVVGEPADCPCRSIEMPLSS